MNLRQSAESRRPQVHRRLSELELAVRVGGELEVAWHLNQARRSGASLPEIRDAIQRALKKPGTPAAALTQCADQLARRGFNAGDARWSGSPPGVGRLSPC